MPIALSRSFLDKDTARRAHFMDARRVLIEVADA
jgi:hypothetical protein